MLARLEPATLSFGALILLLFALDPGTNVDLIMWARASPADTVQGSLTYALSHASWFHLGMNVISIMIFGQLLRSRGMFVSATALVLGGIGGAVAFQFAVLFGTAGVALQGASGIALGLAAAVAVCRGGAARVLAIAVIAAGLWPLGFSGTWFAHLGGAVGGSIAGIEARRTARATSESSPRHITPSNSRAAPWRRSPATLPVPTTNPSGSQP